MPGPTVTVRIDFDSVAFISTPTWTDVSADVMRVNINRGRNYEMNRMETGTAQVQLLNTSGEYWPNTAGTYAGKILPMKKIQIQSTKNGITYNEFTGYIESWQPDFMQDPDRVPVMNLMCVDAMKYLSRYYLNNAGYAEELSGTRINNVLDDLGWPQSATLKEYYNTGQDDTEYLWGIGQTFTVSDNHTIGSVKLYLKRTGTPNIYGVAIRATDGSGMPTGANLTIGYINGNIVSDTAFEWHEIIFNDTIDLINGTKYAIVSNFDIGGGGDYLEWGSDSSSPGYTGGTAVQEVAGVWGAIGSDMLFEEYTSTTRSIEAGQSFMQATGALTNANALEHIYNVLDSEDGNLFVDVNGLIVFQDRSYRQTSRSSAGTVGDQAGDIPWNAIDVSLDDFYVNNDIRITRTGGTQQVSQDSNSINVYGLRTLSKSGLLLTSDGETGLAAAYLLNKYKDAIQRVKSITLRPTPSQADSTYPLTLGNDLSTYFLLRVTQATILNYYYVDGITHRWDAKEPQVWETTWQLSDVTWYNFSLPNYSQIIRPDSAINGTNVAASNVGVYQDLSDSNDTTNVRLYPTGGYFNVTLANPVNINYGIGSVNFTWRCKGQLGTENINAWITVNGVDYRAINHNQVTTSLANYSHVYTLNPATNGYWSWAEINSTNVGLLYDGAAGAGSNINCTEIWANVNSALSW